MGRPTFTLDCSGLPEADAEQLDGLACLCLNLKRRRWELQLANTGAGLLDLIEFAGLAGLLFVEAGREAEKGEEAGGVEKEGELPDPAA